MCLALGCALALGARSSAQVSLDWSAPSRGTSVAVGADDSVFTLDFEQQLGAAMSVTKHAPSGSVLWTSSIAIADPTKWERGQWVDVDGNGNAVACGTLMSGFSNPVVAASVVVKFDPQGAPLWRIVYDSPFDGTSTRKVLVDEVGDIYVLGTGVGSPTVTTKIKKLSPAGATLWTWLDTASIGTPTNFKFGADGHLVVAARAPFGSVNGYAKVDRDTGLAHWALPGIQSLTVGDAAGDAAGHTYVVHGEFVANGGTVVRKLDGSGATLWTRSYASAGARVELDGDGHAIVAGFPSLNAAGAAFFEVDPSGALVWANLDADGPLNLLLHSQLLVDEAGSAYLSAGTLFEMAVCKVDRTGTAAWTFTASPGSGAHGIALGRASRSLAVTGPVTLRLLDPDALGVSYCAPAAHNSTGQPARLAARGSDRAAWNEVTLAASGLPQGVTTLFLNGASRDLVPQAGGSQGALCLGGPLGRYLGPGELQSSDALGRAALQLDLTRTPTPSAFVAAMAGSTWTFQCWYRDANPGVTSNFSDALELALR